MTAVCQECGVDHHYGAADLSHGIIRLIEHAQERMPWMETPINGDMVARQRAGILGPALLFSHTDPEDIDWDEIARQRTVKSHHCKAEDHIDCDGTEEAPVWGWDTCTCNCHPPATPTIH